MEAIPAPDNSVDAVTSIFTRVAGGTYYVYGESVANILPRALGIPVVPAVNRSA